MRVSNILQYDKVTCDPKPSKTVKIRVSDIIGKGATVRLMRTGSNSFSTVLINNAQGESGWIDVTTQLTSGDNDQLKV